MADRFPFPPDDCKARECPRVSVVSHWGSSGYEITHVGAQPFLLKPEDVVTGTWPASALQEFKAVHAREDQEKAASAPEEPIQPAIVPAATKRRGKRSKR